MADTPDKSNDILTLRCPDMLKARFNRVALAKGSTMSGLIISYIESVVEKEEKYVESIADIFGFERKIIKERRVSTKQCTVLPMRDSANGN